MEVYSSVYLEGKAREELRDQEGRSEAAALEKQKQRDKWQKKALQNYNPVLCA